MKFKIEHHTNNEKEYEEIMALIKHWEIIEIESKKRQKEIDEQGSPEVWR